MPRILIQAESLKELQKELLSAKTKEEVVAIAQKIREINKK